MPKRDDVRPVVYLDTNSLHYLDLFVRYVQDNGFTVNDIGSEALVKKLEQVDEVGYRQSLQKGRRIISFVVTVVSARWFGGDALELTCRGAGGELGSEILYRDDEARLEMVEQGRPWSFDGDGELFRLVSEALLPRQQLRFLLADDPGAGKTIMTGLLMKELIARGDLQRCLVVCPGSLAEQWQDELYQRFHLNFEIFTNDKAAAARTGNWFLESKAQEHAVTHIVPEHLQEIRSARLNLLAKTEAAVKDRLTKEIAYWDRRASQLRDQELAGSPCAKLNSGEARRRADTLQARLQQRLRELQLEAQLAPLPPVVLGGVLVVPQGLLAAIRGERPARPNDMRDTQESAARARAVIMDTERALGFEPTDRETEHLGYDIESRVPGTGKLRFIKGRVHDADTITVTRNEILYSLNKPDDYRLAIVEFLDGDAHRVHHLRQPFHREPDFGANSVNYSFKDLLARSEPPC